MAVMSAEDKRFLRMLAKFAGAFTIQNGHLEYDWTRAIYLGLSNKAVEPLAARGWLEARQTDSRATEWRVTQLGAAAYEEARRAA